MRCSWSLFISLLLFWLESGNIKIIGQRSDRHLWQQKKVFECFKNQLCSIFLMISSVNSEHLAEPPRSPVIAFPSLITCKKEHFLKYTLENWPCSTWETEKRKFQYFHCTSSSLHCNQHLLKVQMLEYPIILEQENNNDSVTFTIFVKAKVFLSKA